MITIQDRMPIEKLLFYTALRSLEEQASICLQYMLILSSYPSEYWPRSAVFNFLSFFLSLYSEVVTQLFNQQALHHFKLDLSVNLVIH